MSTSGITVNCSGAVLSSLLYEHLRSGYTQEGFLLGQVCSHISEHISDSQICSEKTETAINISSFVPCTSLGCFYSGPGRVNDKKLRTFLGSNYQNVIGWYRSRGSNCEDLYLREMTVYHQLYNLMTHTGGNFIMGIFSFTPSGTSGTLAINHKFLMLRNNVFEGVSLRVINMGDTSTAEYIMEPPNPALYDSKAIKQVLSELSSVEPGVDEAEKLHMGLLNKLKELLPKYMTAQEKHQQALQEVVHLRALCYVNGITSDFSPSIEASSQNANLIEFDSSLEGPESTEKKTGKTNITGTGKSNTTGTSRSSVKRKVGSKNVKDQITIRNPGDPFGFVNKEMEKLQVENKSVSDNKQVTETSDSVPASQTQGHKSKLANTPNKNKTPSKSVDVENKGKGSPRRTSKEGSPLSTSPLRKSSESPPASPGKGRNKQTRSVSCTKVTNESQSPSRTRGRSPSVTNVSNAKSKVKEAWSKKPSESQEF